MKVIVWQQLGVLVLAILFSLLFSLRNDREQKAKNGRGVK